MALVADDRPKHSPRIPLAAGFYKKIPQARFADWVCFQATKLAGGSRVICLLVRHGRIGSVRTLTIRPRVGGSMTGLARKCYTTTYASATPGFSSTLEKPGAEDTGERIAASSQPVIAPSTQGRMVAGDTRSNGGGRHKVEWWPEFEVKLFEISGTKTARSSTEKMHVNPELLTAQG